MWFIALLVAIAALAIWSTATQYSHTLPGEPVWKRVWHSVVIAVGAAFAALGAWLTSFGPQ